MSDGSRHPRLAAIEERLGVELGCRGAAHLLDRPSIAVVNSRKLRQVSASERWVLATLAAQRGTGAEGLVLVSSLGTLPYELAAWAAVRQAGPLILALEQAPPEPGSAGYAEWRQHYGPMIERRETLVLWPLASGPGASRRLPAQAQALRDRLVDALAGTVAAVEIREQGVWSALLAARLQRGDPVLCGPALDRACAGNKALLAGGARPLALPQAGTTGRRVRRARVAAPLSQTGEGQTPPEAAYLYHYTRGQSGAWPGQSKTEYLEELASGATTAGHTGLDALLRILEGRRICGSSRLIRGAASVCSFTDRDPGQIRMLASWGRGQLRWNFEPYALGFRRGYAEPKGLQPVLQLAAGAFAGLEPAERFRFQRHEPPGCDWTDEGEWRCAGDFSFGDAAPEDVVVLVPDAAAVARIAEAFPFRVVQLPADWPRP